MIANPRFDAGRFRAPADDAVGVLLEEGIGGELAGPTLVRSRCCVSLLSGPFLKGLEIRRHRNDERRDPHFLKRYRWSGAASFW